MIIGIPKEVRPFEGRVGLGPSGVRVLVEDGQEVVVESGAGRLAGFSDDDYHAVGARIGFQPAEVWQRSEIVAKVGPVTRGEVVNVREGQFIAAFHFVQSASRPVLEGFSKRAVSLLGYEQLEDEDGERRVQNRMSEIAGRLAMVIASRHLLNSAGGAGILVSGVPGAAPAEVLILGGGVMGENVCRAALGLGARVTVIDPDLQRLSVLDRTFFGGGRPVLLSMTPRNLERSLSYANVVVACVRTPDGACPRLITRNHLRLMRPGAILIDASIDRGGVAETSRPTTLGDPTYVVDGIVHYAVVNMPADVARTATHALTHSVLPLLRALASRGITETVRTHPTIASGMQMWKGTLVVPAFHGSESLPVRPLSEVL